MTIGVVSDVLQNTAQVFIQVDLEKGGQVLIPAVEEFIKSVDIDEKVVEVSLIPGFIDEAFEI